MWDSLHCIFSRVSVLRYDFEVTVYLVEEQSSYIQVARHHCGCWSSGPGWGNVQSITSRMDAPGKQGIYLPNSHPMLIELRVPCLGSRQKAVSLTRYKELEAL